MDISYINPYSTASIISFADGSQSLQRPKLEYNPAANQDVTHTVKEEDTLWLLANFYYGDDKWWYVIFDVNNIYNPFDLMVGSDLVIPDLNIVRAKS